MPYNYTNIAIFGGVALVLVGGLMKDGEETLKDSFEKTTTTCNITADFINDLKAGQEIAVIDGDCAIVSPAQPTIPDQM